jgi:alkylation response protein AidB-like acyl-CoA dehydrogenase
VIRFGCPELRAEVLPALVNGDAICSLGYTEPSSGSDVFAARTQAVRDGDDWVINGQKMFTSGANLATYVLLLTRTDLQAPKHLGITIFLVPLGSQGIEIHPIYTFQDERTNGTFYSNVRVSDRYRLGPVNGGIQVLTSALELEQGGASYIPFLRKLVATALNWGRNTMRDGKAAIHDPRVLLRLAAVATRTEVADVLCRRSQWATAQKQTKNTYGPMSKVFTTETFLRGATDLLDLTAPGSLMRGKGPLKYIEESHRHSAATTIYAGTSEVMRSMIAEKTLGLPRSRA